MDVGDGMWLAAVWLVVDVEDGTTTGSVGKRRKCPSLLVFVETQGAHTLLGTVIQMFIPASV